MVRNSVFCFLQYNLRIYFSSKILEVYCLSVRMCCEPTTSHLTEPVRYVILRVRGVDYSRMRSDNLNTTSALCDLLNGIRLHSNGTREILLLATQMSK